MYDFDEDDLDMIELGGKEGPPTGEPPTQCDYDPLP
jgi:hypothetical protein